MDLSECVIVAIPRRYVDPWRANRPVAVERYDRWAEGADSDNKALDYAARAAVLRAVESEKAGRPLRVLSDDEVVVSKETAQAWVDITRKVFVGAGLHPNPAKALYDELAPQLAPPRPPVEVGQKRRPKSLSTVRVVSINEGMVTHVSHSGTWGVTPIAIVESWELVEEGTDQ